MPFLVENGVDFNEEAKDIPLGPKVGHIVIQ